MLSFKHDIPTKLYFGEGQIKRLAKSLEPFGKNVCSSLAAAQSKRRGFMMK